MAVGRVCVAACIGLVLLFEVDFVEAVSCYHCTSAESGEDCGIDVSTKNKCTWDGDYLQCMTYQYPFNDSIVTVRDCPHKDFNCKTLFADGKNDSLLMCNECNNDALCNGNIDVTNTCAKCNSLESKDCGNTIEDVGENTCFLDSTVNTECFVYKYKEDSTTVTVRDCGRANTCATLRSAEDGKTILMCDECSNTDGINCNQNITASKTCVECNSLDEPGCESGTVDTSVITGTCDLDDAINTECITYKYKNATTTVTVRGCAPKDTCSTFHTDTFQETLVMCHECSSDTSNCNQNLDDLATCVECNSLQDTECNQPKINTSTTTGVCYLDNLVSFECITYQYLKNDNSTVSVRGCAPDKNCASLYSDTYKDNLLMCDECSGDSNCNKEFDTTNTCIECSSLNDTNCQESSADLSTVCYLDQTVKTQCITYKINNENNQAVTIKGCAPTDECSNLLSSEKSALLMCDECTNTDSNNCNEEVDITKTCIECNSEDNPDCGNFKIDPSITNATCYLDQTVNQECVMYKYQKDSKTSVVVRGCAPTNGCANMGSENDLLYCYQCSSDQTNNCNENIDTSKTCVKCNSNDDTNCGDSIVKIPGTCLLDETVHTECIAYKYQIDDTTQVTIRDCAPKDYCETLHNSSLIMCNHCTTKDCNKKIDHSNRCIECNSIDDPDNCDEGRADTSQVKGRCDLDDTVNVQCVSYKYFQDGKTNIYRGCGSKNFCDNSWSNTTACRSCDNTESGESNICNKEAPPGKEKVLCIQCTSEDDEECAKDDMNSSKIKEYCHLDDTNTECVAYKYLNLPDGKIHTYRGCAPKNQCAVLNAYTNTTICTEGTTLISNKKIDTSTEATFCVKCKDEEGSSCAAEDVDLSKVDLCKISNKEEKSCFAHKYLNDENGKMITERGCDSPSYCDQHNTDYTALCVECHDEICNNKINVTNEKAFCVACDGEEGTECGNEKITDLSQVRFCGLDNTANFQCIAHRYLNVTSKKISIHRGCEAEDYCDQFESDGKTISCTKCKGNDGYCNQDIDKNDEKTLCVKCDSEGDESECSKDTVDLAQVDFCGIASTEQRQCVAYRYLNVTTNKFSTHRGCEPKDYCAKYNTTGTSIVCDECKDDSFCNMAIDPTNVTLCVQCDGEECAADTSDLTKVGFCKIDSTKDNCVAYRYLDVKTGNISTHRGCEKKKYCNKQNNGTKIICSECYDDNNCNKEIEADKEKTLCVSCDGEACASNTVDLKQVDFCGLASSDSNQCATYRYLDVTSGKLKTHKGCEIENYCAQYKNESTTLLCNECRTGELCNRYIENEETFCVECSGDEGSECANDNITDFTKVTFCKVSSSNKQQCVSYRYLNVTSGKISTYRGCEPDNYCDSQSFQSSKSEIAMICSTCTSTDEICNAKIDTSSEQTMCVECTGEEGTDCANNTINDLKKVKFCTLTDKQQCVTYKYLNSTTNKINIKRGCETTNYCNKFQNENNTLICDECHDEFCNMKTVNKGKFICVQCNGEEESECANNTVNLAEVESCIINSTDNQQCVSHKYLDVATGKINTYRGCAAKDYCQQQNQNDSGRTALCEECNDSDHCNMNVDASKELTLCVECIGEGGSNCAAATVDLTEISFCGINTKNSKECIGYRYLEVSTNKVKTVRSCVTTNCSNLVVDDGEIQQCYDCHENICNNYLEIVTTTTAPPNTTTSGAASIVQYKFNISFFYLIIGLLYLVH